MKAGRWSLRRSHRLTFAKVWAGKRYWFFILRQALNGTAYHETARQSVSQYCALR